MNVIERNAELQVHAKSKLHATIFFVSRSQKKTTNNFDRIEIIQSIPGSKMQENIREIEWNSFDKNANVLGLTGNWNLMEKIIQK